MASLNSLQTRNVASRGIIKYVADDTCVAVRLKYCGNGRVTSVTTSATNLVTVTVESGSTVTKTYAMTSHANYGSLVDKINSDGIFYARVLDARNATLWASGLAVEAALTITADGYYDIISKTSAADYLAARLCYDRSPIASKTTMGHRVHLSEIGYTYTAGGSADANSIRVYQYNPLTMVETLLWQGLPVSGAATTITFASGRGKISSDEGCDLLVYLLDATSVTGSLYALGEAE